ncbi:MAG: LysE family transporter [Bacillota bacterium]
MSAFVIGFSGAMMPGPMLGVTIHGSLKKGYIAGPQVVLGHGILELILLFAMIFGLKDFFSNQTVAGYIGVVGGIYLTWMGVGMIKSSVQKAVSLENQDVHGFEGKNLILAGGVVSATNPYFILWWATTGIELVRQSLSVGLAGIFLFFIGHILADLIWYSAVSTAFSKGQKLMNDAIYHWLIFILGLFIIGFSTYFIGNGWRVLFYR